VSRTRLKYLYSVVDERAGADRPPLLAVSIHLGVVPRSQVTDDLPRADDLSSYKVCRGGDIVVNRMRAFQGAIGLSATVGLVSPDYLVLRPNDSVAPYFLHHLLGSTWLVGEMTSRLRGIGGTDTGSVRTPRINAWDLGDIEVELPPLEEQRAIAGFLDVETARIDALIDKKRRLITLLDERLEATIRRRLSTLDCPRLPLKRFWSVVDCKHRTPTYADDGYPVVSPGDATAGRLDLSRCHRFVSESDYRDLAAPPRRPMRGSIIYSRNASIGVASYVDTDRPFCMGQDVCLINSPGQDQLFLTYVLNSIGVDQLDAEKIGSTFSRINVSQILELEVPTPPVHQQRSISREFDEASRSNAEVTSRLHRQIGLLEEKRGALITAAVTGEFAVPGVAAA